MDMEIADMMIHVKDITLTYPGAKQAALSGVSFEIERGSRTALIGANGAGKSTLLKTLVGILPKQAGIIKIGGLELNSKNEAAIRRKAGLVFQNPDDQLFMARVWDDVAFGPANYGCSGKELEELVSSNLKNLNILHLQSRNASDLSYGEKRMAALASVLSMEPEILLFDEPSAFLDPKARRILIGQLRKLPYTQLIATHDLDLVREVCGRVMIMKKGCLYAEGDPQALLSDQRLMEECELI